MKFLIVEPSPLPILIPLGPKYSPQDPVFLTGKPIGKRPLGRPRRRWEDNIRMDLNEMGINTRN